MFVARKLKPSLNMKVVEDGSSAARERRNIVSVGRSFRPHRPGCFRHCAARRSRRQCLRFLRAVEAPRPRAGHRRLRIQSDRLAASWSRDKRIVGFINKASDGLPPAYYCSGGETEIRLCKALWKRHAVARELFHTRRTVAKALGLKWGAYHLARPGNPIDQANNFIDFAEPGARRPDRPRHRGERSREMDVARGRRGFRPPHPAAASAASRCSTPTARPPLHIADNRDRYRLLSRLPLWYARYKPAIGLHFPKGNWQTYTLWQFSAAGELRRALLPLPRAGHAARHRRQRRLDERRRAARRMAVRRAGRRDGRIDGDG